MGVLDKFLDAIKLNDDYDDDEFLDDDLLDDLEEHIEKATGFHVLDHELKFYGLCSKCQKKENEEK